MSDRAGDRVLAATHASKVYERLGCAVNVTFEGGHSDQVVSGGSEGSDGLAGKTGRQRGVLRPMLSRPRAVGGACAASFPCRLIHHQTSADSTQEPTPSCTAVDRPPSRRHRLYPGPTVRCVMARSRGAVTEAKDELATHLGMRVEHRKEAFAIARTNGIRW
jgi:hypothetical protein